MTPRTILYINGTAEYGGTDTDLFVTVRALDMGRFRPIVMLPGHGPFDDAYAAVGVEVIHARLPMINRSARPGPFLAGLYRSVREIRRLIRRRKVDLVYTNSLLVLSGGIAARIAGRPALWHSGELLDRPRLVGQALYWLVAALATRIVVSSAAVQARFPTWSRSKVDVLHNGIDLDRFHPSVDGSVVRRQFGIPIGVPVVGFVGRLVPWKGVDQFIHLAARVRAQVPDAHFLIVGGRLAGYSGYPQHLRALIGQLGLGERALLLEDRPDVANLMAAMDVFVHCSTKPEPFGIVIVEAMAAGKPVVAVNAGGVPEIISTPEVGILVPPGPIEASAREVIGLLRDPLRAQQLGRAARRHVERQFDIAEVTRRAETIYAQACDNHPRPSPTPRRPSPVPA